MIIRNNFLDNDLLEEHRHLWVVARHVKRAASQRNFFGAPFDDNDSTASPEAERSILEIFAELASNKQRLNRQFVIRIAKNIVRNSEVASHV